MPCLHGGGCGLSHQAHDRGQPQPVRELGAGSGWAPALVHGGASVRGRVPGTRHCWVSLAQVLGAITAAALCIQAGVAKELTLGPQGHHNWFQVGLLETIYACMMCLVYLNCAASKKNNPKEDQNGFVGIAVGFCYLASQNATQGICSTVSNSAIAIGLIAYGKGGGTHISHGVGYFLYDLLGAFLAAGAYRVVRPQEFRSLIMSSAIQENIQESALLGAEYIGTFYIVLTQVLTMLSSTGGDIGPQAWGTAAVVVAMVYALRDVSGAHFNPAVTMAVRASGRAPAEDLPFDSTNLRFGVFYALSQVLAAVSAALIIGLVYSSISTPTTKLEATAGQIMFAECFGVFFLCYVVLASSVTSPVDGSRSSQNNLAGLAYGSVVLSSTLTVGNISGALLNPVTAVTVIMVGASGRNSLIVYTIYHVSAGVLAAAAFLVTHAQLYVKDARDADDERLAGI
ncbi:unnamed protein product [Effrenium voratum]|uniref:Aquaporin n=1 Tax=Effrenium voratum TaxID=2562239 RepID=A0AA36I863_9DINO|nr:unnamed protein product [Effrenium voratum]